VGSNGDNTYCP